MTAIIADKVFKVSGHKSHVICPPDQVFVKTDFDFLLTIGGDLVNNEKEFEKLKVLLREIGETEFNILENIGATITDRDIAFEEKISLNSSYNDFKDKVSVFDPPFGWKVNHFFVYGRIDNWGIYICEYPTINIIGCDNNISQRFRQVFSIVGNGYNELADFINQEFRSKEGLKELFLQEYKL